MASCSCWGVCGCEQQYVNTCNHQAQKEEKANCTAKGTCGANCISQSGCWPKTNGVCTTKCTPVEYHIETPTPCPNNNCNPQCICKTVAITVPRQSCKSKQPPTTVDRYQWNPVKTGDIILSAHIKSLRQFVNAEEARRQLPVTIFNSDEVAVGKRIDANHFNQIRLIVNHLLNYSRIVEDSNTGIKVIDFEINDNQLVPDVYQKGKYIYATELNSMVTTINWLSRQCYCKDAFECECFGACSKCTCDIDNAPCIGQCDCDGHVCNCHNVKIISCGGQNSTIIVCDSHCDVNCTHYWRDCSCNTTGNCPNNCPSHSCPDNCHGYCDHCDHCSHCDHTAPCSCNPVAPCSCNPVAPCSCNPVIPCSCNPVICPVTGTVCPPNGSGCSPKTDPTPTKKKHKLYIGMPYYECSSGKVFVSVNFYNGSCKVKADIVYTVDNVEKNPAGGIVYLHQANNLNASVNGSVITVANGSASWPVTGQTPKEEKSMFKYYRGSTSYDGSFSIGVKHTGSGNLTVVSSGLPVDVSWEEE